MSPNFHHGAVRGGSGTLPQRSLPVFTQGADLPSGQYVVCKIELGSSS